MIALVDVLADALQRNVLLASEQVQAADRRVAIRTAREKGCRRLPAGRGRDCFRFIPACANNGVVDVLRFADDDDIQGVSRVCAFGVDDAARQCLEGRNECPGIGKVGDVVFPVYRLEVDVVMVDSETGDLDEERERPVHLVVEEVDVERLGALVGIGKDEPGTCLARANPHVHAVTEEFLLGLLALLVAAGQRGDLQRRVVIRVDAERQEPDRLVRHIFDFDPDRLYAFPVERHAEELARLFLVGNRGGNADIVFDLGDRALAERHRLHGLEIETRCAAGQQADQQRCNSECRRPMAGHRVHRCIHRGGGSHSRTSISGIDIGSADSHMTMR